ncbi:hypothetical protein MJK72_07860 [Klebsiella pneumoniae]|nr:hypothetical protein MJK72_07860 [Klebsiella pneumoniae]
MPQALLQPQYRGAVNLRKVDSGVPAAVLHYQANSYQSIVDGDTSSHHYLGLDVATCCTPLAGGYITSPATRRRKGSHTGIALPPGLREV